MKRSCHNFRCFKFGKTCDTCSKQNTLCIPTCDDCKNKKNCMQPKDLNRRLANET